MGHGFFIVKSPFVNLADLILHHPRSIAIACVIVLIIAFFGMSLISMATGSDTYLDKDTRRGMLLDDYTGTFQSDSIMVLIEADDVLTPGVLAYIDGLEREIGKEQNINSVSGIPDLMKSVNGGILPVSSAEITQAENRIPPEVLIRFVPSRTMTFAVAMLKPGLSQEQQSALVNSLTSRIGVSDRPPGVSVVLTGNSAFQQQMQTEMSTSMSVLILAAMVLMVLAVGLLFGHVRYRLLSVVIVALGLILTFGIIGWSGMQINMATIGAFPVLIGIGIDYAIQFHSRFDEEIRKGTLNDAVRNTITRAGPSVLYAMLATSMGFLAMYISPLPMIRSFGIVCVIGVVSCYLAGIVLVPLFGILVNYRAKEEPLPDAGSGKKQAGFTQQYNQLLGTAAAKVAKNPIPVLLLIGLIALVGFQLDDQIIVNTNEDTFVPKDMPAKIYLDKVSRAMGSAASTPIIVRSDNVLSVDTVQWMLDFQDYEETHNGKITGSTSIATYILAYNDGKMPETASEVNSIVSLIPEAVKKRYVDGRTQAIIEFSTIEMENEVGMSMMDQIRKDLEWNKPPIGTSASVTGMGEMFSNLIREIRQGKMLMTILGFGLIFGFLLVVYRKVIKAATPLVPIMLIVGWNGLIMYLMGIDYTPLTATLGSMSVGVASEYTILIMERCYEERDRGLALIPAIQNSVQQIGTAITVSGMTTVFGFAALMLSSFGIISNFGLVTVISVFFALIGAILVMPAILVLAGRFEKEPETS
jgi:hydrophobe/amphiphile efflux-3 (HAE3) family protein